MKRLLTVLAVLGSLSAAAAAARSTFATAVDGLPAPAATHHPPDILLVTIDALRADHLSSYGYPLFTSPTLDAFARHAVRFTNAIAPGRGLHQQDSEGHQLHGLLVQRARRQRRDAPILQRRHQFRIDAHAKF